MKILYLNTLYAPIYGGGAEVTLKTLVEGVQKAGHEVVVLTLAEQERLQEDSIDGVRVIRAKLQNIYWHQYENKPARLNRIRWHLKDIDNKDMAKVLTEVLDKEKPDVVSCHNLIGWSSSAWKAINDKNIPIVQVLHDLYNICGNSTMFKNDHSCKTQCTKCKLFRLNHPKNSNVVSAVVGVSQYILDRHIEFGLFSESPIQINIKNIRNYDLKSLAHNISTTDNKIRFGFIGALIPSKGIEYLIQEFRKLNKATAELIIAGNGDEEYFDYLRSIAPQNITFLGQTTPNNFYPRVDVVIVPSLWNDTLPGVVFESFIYGKPVIGSRRGGIPEMVNSGSNGFLFEPDKKDELLSILEQIIKTPAVLNNMSIKAKHSGQAFLDINKWIADYINLYEKVKNT